MGCDADKERKIPILLCDFEKGNDDQKDYCLKLKDSFKYEKPIKYEIRSNRIDPFSIRLKKKNKIYDIQTNYIDNSEEEIQKALTDIYTILDE